MEKLNFYLWYDQTSSTQVCTQRQSFLLHALTLAVFPHLSDSEIKSSLFRSILMAQQQLFQSAYNQYRSLQLHEQNHIEVVAATCLLMYSNAFSFSHETKISGSIKPSVTPSHWSCRRVPTHTNESSGGAVSCVVALSHWHCVGHISYDL